MMWTEYIRIQESEFRIQKSLATETRREWQNKEILVESLCNAEAFSLSAIPILIGIGEGGLFIEPPLAANPDPDSHRGCRQSSERFMANPDSGPKALSAVAGACSQHGGGRRCKQEYIRGKRQEFKKAYLT